MKIAIAVGRPEQQSTDLLVLGLFEKEPLSAELKRIDRRLNGEMSRLMKEKAFEGKKGELRTITTLGALPARRIMVAGLGKRKEYTVETLRQVSAGVAKSAECSRIASYTSLLHQADMKGRSRQERAYAVVEGTALALYSFDRYKTEGKDERKKISGVVLLESDRSAVASLRKAVRKAEMICAATNYVRDLVNTPASVRTATYLGDEALKIGKENRIRVAVYDKKQIEKMGFNALLAVNRGSDEEPRFIVMDYNPGKKPHVAVVGKGITFDSGGLDIKTWPYMVDMKSDMAGAGAILGTMKVISRLGLPLRVTGIIPATDNMPGGHAYRAGDIIEAYNKKTIEIQNTDAEGRVILSDGLSYAAKMKPDAIIDLATLTGAATVALGYYAAALLGTDRKLIGRIQKAAEETHERVWELPLWDEYGALVKSDVADVRNIAKDRGEAGVITAAAFLKTFVGDIPWAHLDIAATAWFKEAEHYTPQQATGYGVRLLVNLLENWKR